MNIRSCHFLLPYCGHSVTNCFILLLLWVPHHNRLRPWCILSPTLPLLSIWHSNSQKSWYTCFSGKSMDLEPWHVCYIYAPEAHSPRHSHFHHKQDKNPFSLALWRSQSMQTIMDNYCFYYHYYSRPLWSIGDMSIHNRGLFSFIWCISYSSLQ